MSKSLCTAGHGHMHSHCEWIGCCDSSWHIRGPLTQWSGISIELPGSFPWLPHLGSPPQSRTAQIYTSNKRWRVNRGGPSCQLAGSASLLVGKLAACCTQSHIGMREYHAHGVRRLVGRRACTHRHPPSLTLDRCLMAIKHAVPVPRMLSRA